MPLLAKERPYRTLAIVFVAWKVLLLAVATGSQVGPTYDTSSSLLTLNPDHNSSHVRNLVTRLVSWDAIYFVKAAQRGYLFEQEWAFGSALPACISFITRALQSLGILTTSNDDTTAYIPALIGVIVTHASHYLSTLVLHSLTLAIWADGPWALTSALLHILSPAGLFLSAPYAESSCSLLSFAGWLLLAKSCSSASAAKRDVLTLLAGMSFGFATVFRTNGLLNGAPFAFEALGALYQLVEDLESARHVRRLVVAGLAGLFVAAGTLVPQLVAYKTYCVVSVAGQVVRPWCSGYVPSIYNFVQKEYWNAGFLHYWTLGNLPLFLLAAPMLFIMSKGGKDIFFQTAKIVAPPTQQPPSRAVDHGRLRLIARSMVFAQVLLVVLAITNYHVQIITRLSSGYPPWYWWVAACLRSVKTRDVGSGLLVYMVMYALIQAVLFASFLPPA